MEVACQENRRCHLISCIRGTANVFEYYANGNFAVKSGGFMYGTVSLKGKVEVSFVYEPPQRSNEDELLLQRDPEEESLVEAIAFMFGVKKLGFIFTQSKIRDWTMSAKEMLQAVEMEAESKVNEWVTVVVNSVVFGRAVHCRAFQMTDLCIKLFKEGWFETEIEGKDVVSKLVRTKKDLVVEGKLTRQVATDFFLVPVKNFDHKKVQVSTIINFTRNRSQEKPNYNYSPPFENPHLGPVQKLANHLRMLANEGPNQNNPSCSVLVDPLQKLVNRLRGKVNEHSSNQKHGCSVSDFMIFDPPRFDGTTGPILAHKWLEDIEKILNIIKCSDD